jgi:magnesium-transporting ATPase (P-type)
VNLVFMLGIIVANVPEGLLPTFTLSLAMGSLRMARKNVLVKSLNSVEAMGALHAICTDKTGTLTRNEMTVVSVVTQGQVFCLEGAGYEPRGLIKLNDAVVRARDHGTLAELGRSAALCNDASLHARDDVWQVEGDPMEGALLAMAGKVGIDIRSEIGNWTRTDAIPFDAKHRFMATLNHDHANHAFVFVKGAPEQILSMCREQRTAAGATEAIDTDYWITSAEQVAAQGQRVLAFAVKPVAPEHTVLELSDVANGLILIGLVGMMDPPRQDAIDAIAECHRAGIRVKMITGDHKATAAAIARQIGLVNPHTVMTGADLDAIDDAALGGAVLDTDVFARTSPEHKLRLVMALQAHGMTVAMTGDGVNDAPALKRADAGIAMGLKGSEAAKESAELVLADDNFASIVAAVREGRTVYDNIKKVIGWTLPTNAGEALTIVVALLFGMHLPITPIQILWVNLITAITLGVALAFEPTEAHTMLRPPRSRQQPLLTGELGWHIVVVSALFLGGVFGIYAYAVDRGYSFELARTIAMNTLVVMEIFHLFFIRNIYGTSLTWQAAKGTKVVWATVIGVTSAQFAVTYLPPLQTVFATEPVPFVDGILIVAVGVALFAIIETEKQIRLRLRELRSS